MLAIPVVLLSLLELGLRLAGYGSSYPLFVAAPSQPEYLHPNHEVAKRYFRAGTITPLPHLDFFRAQKQPGTFRIVFQGESSAAGFPYRRGGAPSRMLEQRLQATFPDRDIEVVNTALTGISSYTLLDFADEIIAQRPDAVLIYTGHNEYYGAFGVGSTRTVGGSRPLIKAYLTLSRLRIVQLLNNVIAAPAAMLRRDGGGEPRTVMELLAGEQKIPLGSPIYTQGLQQFRANLGELFARYQTKGIPVFIGTVASNERDQQPLESSLAAGTDSAAWWRSYRAGLAAFHQGDPQRAEAAFQSAFRLDSTAADASYALAKLYDARGDHARARPFYRAAKESDQLRFRAPEAINRIIREEAARHGATVVETRQALERAAPGGIIGGTLMLEHLHPNIDGYFLIADAFYNAFRQNGIIGSWEAAIPVERARHEVPVTRVDSLVGLFRTDRLVSGWPFQPRGKTVIPVVDTLQPRNLEEQLAQQLVRGTLAWPEAMDRLRSHYERAGDMEQAMRVARTVAQEYRTESEPLMDAGRIALTLRRYDEAVSYLRRAAELAPGDQRISFALMAAEALPELEQGRVRAPHDPGVLFNLGAAYAATQQYEQARDVLMVLRQTAPDHIGARDLLRKLPR